MSTAYTMSDRSLALSKDELLAALEDHAIELGEERDDGSFSITDGSNHLWVYPSKDDPSKCADFERFSDNSVEDIIDVLQDMLDCDIYSEHDPEYDELYDED